jgi:tetratricopeptide (TPR) repeat protein
MTDTGKRPAPRAKRAKRDPAPSTPDPVEIAMEAEAADKAPDSPARVLLIEHARLIRSQRLSEQMGAGLKAMTGLLGLAIAVAMIAMVWQASTERGLVIEAFSAPPDLQARGLTGQVLASQLEDKLSALQAKADSARAATTYSNDWGHDIRVEIPQTGVSISELQRYLRQWLGHQTRVGGEVFRTAKGLSLTVRTGGEAGDTVTGSDADLDTLLQNGALALFARTQPYRYGVYLSQNGRRTEAQALYAKLANEGPTTERAWATLGLGLTQDNFYQGLAALQSAVSLDPRLALAWFDLGGGQATVGRNQDALNSLRTTVTLLKSRDHGGMNERSAITSLPLARGQLAALTGNYREALRQYTLVAQAPDYHYTREANELALPEILAELHEPTAGASTLPSGTDAELTERAFAWGGFSTTRTSIAMEREDWTGALAELQAMETRLGELSDGAGQTASFTLASRLALAPVKARILARLGRAAEAEASLTGSPGDCYPCLVSHGFVAAKAGKAADADRWFALAERQGPALPQADLEWGRALLARGDTAGALARLSAASAKEPNFADPLELWGEALMARGDNKAALRKFSAAAALTPRWGRLHLMWGQALARLGRRDEARDHWRLAAGLDLSPTDRTALAAQR